VTWYTEKCAVFGPRLTCCNLDVHNPITMNFARSVTEKVRNQMMLCFPTLHI